MDNQINCKNYRRFGVEVELNPVDGVVKKWDAGEGELPAGSDYVAHLINKATRDVVTIEGWDHHHNNGSWIVKSDSSCGIEVCSPILKGWRGLKKMVRVIDFFKKSNIKADQRCSLHVHVNVSDFNKVNLATVIAYWIKCEHVFFDSVPDIRKNNRYCQFIGMTDLFSHDQRYGYNDVINRVSGVKYYSINAYHLQKGGGIEGENNRRKTIEFRIGENDICVSPWDAKNWIRLILHFVDCVKHLPFPAVYQPGNPYSGLLWLDPKDVFSILGFDKSLSPGLQQVRDWFFGRLNKNGFNSRLSGIWSNDGRSASRKNFIEYCESCGIKDFGGEVDSEKLYSEKYAF